MLSELDQRLWNSWLELMVALWLADTITSRELKELYDQAVAALD